MRVGTGRVSITRLLFTSFLAPYLVGGIEQARYGDAEQDTTSLLQAFLDTSCSDPGHPLAVYVENILQDLEKKASNRRNLSLPPESKERRETPFSRKLACFQRRLDSSKHR